MSTNLDEMARKIAAAAMSTHIGIRSTDHFRRTYCTEEAPIGQEWLDLAAQAQQLILNNTAALRRAATP